MKTFILILALCSLSVDAAYPKGKATESMMAARCAGFAEVSGLEFKRTILNLAKAYESLTDFQLGIEMGYAAGMIVGTDGKSDEEIKKTARKLYKLNCVK